MSRSNSIELRAEGVIVDPVGYREIMVQLEGTDVSQLLDHVKAEDAVDHFGYHEILNQIPIDEIIKHYGRDELLEEMYIDPGFERLR